MTKQCYACGAETSINPTTGWSHWIHNPPTNLLLCRKCYLRHIANPRTNKAHHARRLNFKGRSIYLGYNPRNGVCTECGKSVQKTEIPYTQMHHRSEYFAIFPWFGTEELCPRCHADESWKLGQIRPELLA
jgi:hypothetical protein